MIKKTGNNEIKSTSHSKYRCQYREHKGTVLLCFKIELVRLSSYEFLIAGWNSLFI